MELELPIRTLASTMIALSRQRLHATRVKVLGKASGFLVY